MPIMKAHGPYIYNVNNNLDILVIARYHVDDDQARNWSTEDEEKALAASNGVTDFIDRCLKNKKELYKWLKNVESQKTEQS